MKTLEINENMKQGLMMNVENARKVSHVENDLFNKYVDKYNNFVDILERNQVDILDELLDIWLEINIEFIEFLECQE